MTSGFRRTSAERAARNVLAAALTAGACLTAGCSRDDSAYLSGMVRIDGQPPAEGSIAFFPLDGKSFTSGAEIAEGRYEARVPVSELRVEIRVPRKIGEQKLYDAPDSPVQSILEESLPAKFNDASELRVTTEPGRQTVNFDLSAK